MLTVALWSWSSSFFCAPHGHAHPESRPAHVRVGTFAVMYQMGFSLNNISLMALTLAVGSW
jgi:hypothetical protein